ncbi:helix-turn-helix domain-containing protein [Aeromonas caviae]|jgi:transcriptional regulator with XRE-family HTH domain|uniref:Helix-turn-helix transcriptional regulator n=2 Tax=Aeromonadaceae TaxID=84642 RepID=A0A3N9Y7P5_AERCA|nr:MULTISPECIES: helix-turn-helix transcriptional regulator [Aeromonas]MBP4033122.1 helix-turn-helix transcriptional regulator [Aeromonas sp. PrichA-15]AUY08653.1 XRE family transcriptional regulator [Aeromonas sp. ASNIH2]KEP89014.1 XRE family transcriptional regulator [Aeromonas caviae]KOG94106.1 XRE family transcriptional regulator [Aeromonas caviae]OEG02922.1 XRE family transcriptional regulator [Aeromonas caviae]
MMADASLQAGPKELDPASLGLAIRERRKAARMTQEVTASLCGISKKTLIKIEKGGDVYLSTLLQVMKALGLHLQLVQEVGSQVASGNSQPEVGDDEWF